MLNSLMNHKVKPIGAIATSKRLVFSFLLMAGFFTACQSSYHVTHIDSKKDREELDDLSSSGFIYAIPSTHFKLSIEGHLQETIKGRLSEFNHLVKYPSGNVNKETKRVLWIDSIGLKAYTRPDPERMYNVRLPQTKQGIFRKGNDYQIQVAENLMLSGTHTSDAEAEEMTQPECHLINRHVKIPEQGSGSMQSDQNKLKFDQQSVKQGVEQLLNLNQTLVDQLRQTRNDTAVGDSLMQVKLQEMETNVDRYLGQIKEIKSLFEAYRGENLAEKAQEFSKIIHKLVELKTTLAGADAAIDYPHTQIAPMIQTIDTMINNYLTPFKAKSKEHAISWEFPFHPGKDSLKFKLGIFKNHKDQYYLDRLKGRSNFEAILLIQIQPESLESLEKFAENGEPEERKTMKQGLVYNIPASADLSIQLKHPGKAIATPLAQSTITLPQLGVANTLPLDQGKRHYRFNPFTGALKSVEQHQDK